MTPHEHYLQAERLLRRGGPRSPTTRPSGPTGWSRRAHVHALLATARPGPAGPPRPNDGGFDNRGRHKPAVRAPAAWLRARRGPRSTRREDLSPSR